MIDKNKQKKLLQEIIISDEKDKLYNETFNKYSMIEENKKAEILAMGETDTYFLIDECGAFIWRMNHEMAHDRIPQEHHEAINTDIATVSELQQFAVNNLTRFGIDPESAKDRKNGDYWKWYKFWDNWKKGLSNEDWNAVENALRTKQSYNNYLPTTTWKDQPDEEN